MPKFRKKPVVIEAVQFTGDNAHEVWQLCAAAEFHNNMPGTFMLIKTLEGNMVADPGDWIIRGVKGEFYPCKPDIFAATYETVAP
jgi:hypothetical protein